MNKKSRKLLTWCLVLCMVLTQMLFTNVAFAANRYSGTNRYLTALEIVKNGWTKSDAAVIARGDELADALAAAPLAYAKGNAPILLTETNALPAGVMDELVALGVKNVYIVGGTGAVSADVEKALQDKFGAANVARIYGANRVETAYKVAKEAFTADPAAVVLANAYAYADALSVSSVAAAKGMPVLLVDGTMTPEVAAYVAGKTVYAVGGTAVLPDASLPAGAKRLSGANRYATNAAILTEFAADLDYTKVYVAKGEDDNLADALAGSALAALTKSPIVLADASNSVAAATNVLKANLKEESTVVGLGGSAALADAALAAVEGLRPVAPATLQVESVSATNLKEVVVKFNKAVDSDTIDTANFVIDGATITDATLADDDKTVTLTVSSPLTNDEDYDVTVKTDVKDADGNALKDEYTQTVHVQDVTLPEVESAKFVGPQTVELTFSEPINQADSNPEITIDDNTYSAQPADNGYDGNVVTIDLGTELDPGKHTFKIKGFADYVPYTMVTKTLEVNYEDVTSAPTVTVEKATQSYVTLKFNRPVKGIDLTAFYQTYSSWKPLEIQDGDGNVLGSAAFDENSWVDEVKLVFVDSAKAVPDNNDTNDRPLPTGTTKVVVLTEGDNYAIEDRWGNNLDDDVVLPVTITADNVKPTVTKIVVDDEENVNVYFSEDVTTASATDKDNVVIKDSDGNKIANAKFDLVYTNDNDEYKLNIHFHSPLDIGKYTVTLEGIKDVSLAGNALDTVTREFEITDSTGIDLTSVTVTKVTSDRIIYVDFGEAMATTGQYSVLNPDNYMFGASELDSDVKLSMFTDKIVKMQFPVGTNLDDAAYANLTIGRVADAAGNLSQQLYATRPVEDESAPEVTAIKKVAENKFELTINKELKSVNAAGIQVSNDNGSTWTTVASISFTNDGDDTLIKVTVPSAVKDAGTEVMPNTYLFRTVAGKIKSLTGSYMENVTYGPADNGSIVGVTYKDGVAPKISTDNLDDNKVYAYDTDSDNLIDTIKITYSEDINPNTLSKYTYEVSGYDVSSVSVLGNVVTITIDEVSDNENDLNAEPTVTQVYNIEDMAGNTFKADPIDAISAIDAANPSR